MIIPFKKKNVEVDSSQWGVVTEYSFSDLKAFQTCYTMHQLDSYIAIETKDWPFTETLTQEMLYDLLAGFLLKIEMI
jgi:hypothetical protein